MRRFRLVFEEVVPEGGCKGSVLKRYRDYPIIMVSSIPGFNDKEISKIQYHIIKTALEDFAVESLEKWDYMEHPEKYEGSTEEFSDNED